MLAHRPDYSRGLYRGHRAPRLEGVPETTHRVDQDRTGRVFLHLLAQAQHVDVYGTVRDRTVLAPDGIQQLLSAEDHTRPVHQELQQPEFGGGEGQRDTVQPDLAAGAVQFHAPGFEQARGSGLIAELELDAGNQLAHEERLDYVIV